MIYFKSNILTAFAMMLAIIMINYGIAGKVVLQYQIESKPETNIILEPVDGYFDDIALGISKCFKSLVKILHEYDELGFGLKFNAHQASIRFYHAFTLCNIFLLIPYRLLTQYYIDINAP
ncbi:MAG: hypothetical protein ACOVQ4_19405 [Flectobacillus sp.]|uniref:hypothetical protein n=1 Tax=Flectobacillus sp. TaxID=50419 RepID=UPI003B9B3B0F